VLSLLATSNNATFDQICARTGLSQQTVCAALNGQKSMTADTAQRLARALGVKTDLFLDVLRVYTGWPPGNNRGKKQSVKASVSPEKQTIAE
jgi:plasmid maintenance system antidote protein VapI